MSSEMFSRPIDWSRHDLVYAGAQKNLGPAGVTLVIIRKSLLEQARRDLPAMFRFDLHAEKGSCLNTPHLRHPRHGPGLQVDHGAGWLDAMQAHNLKKAGLIYEAIDESDFYTGHAGPDCRSTMNITFTCPDAGTGRGLSSEAVAATACMRNLKGHRSIGGLRASTYNAFPSEEGCRTTGRR